MLARSKFAAIVFAGLLCVVSDVSAVPSRERVALGGSELVSGIPGEGPLTLEQVERWLADPRNHAELDPQLPLGLAAGKSQIKGLDTNPLTRAKIELGRQLYFDPRLSRDGTISCASCHEPDHGFAAATQFGIGVDGQEGTRNSPAVYNRILSLAQFWDGRAATLEDQAIGPIANPTEMAHTHDACAACVAGNRVYAAQFKRIFPDGVTIENVGKALASFERVLVTGPTPWDYYDRLAAFEKAYADDLADLEALAEDDPDLHDEYLELQDASAAHPLSDSAIRGGKLFFSDRSNCSACHTGANFSDELYHNLGVGFDTPQPDQGRYEVTQHDADRGAFRTPTLRNVAQTAPYMHDGSQQTLAEVVAWYVQGGHPNPHLDKEVTKLDLTKQDEADLVEFMQALTGTLPAVETARLPE